MMVFMDSNEDKLPDLPEGWASGDDIVVPVRASHRDRIVETPEVVGALKSWESMFALSGGPLDGMFLVTSPFTVSVAYADGSIYVGAGKMKGRYPVMEYVPSNPAP